MVEWLEVARGLAIDFLKLVLFWYAENQRGAGLKNKAGIDTESGKEQSGVWLQQLARSIFCEQEKEAVVIDLKDCQSRFGWASFFSGFITGILFACFACFAAWAGYRSTTGTICPVPWAQWRRLGLTAKADADGQQGSKTRLKKINQVLQ